MHAYAGVRSTRLPRRVFKCKERTRFGFVDNVPKHDIPRSHRFMAKLIGMLGFNLHEDRVEKARSFIRAVKRTPEWMKGEDLKNNIPAKICCHLPFDMIYRKEFLVNDAIEFSSSNEACFYVWLNDQWPQESMQMCLDDSKEI
jgi:hypothetical protein